MQRRCTHALVGKENKIDVETAKQQQHGRVPGAKGRGARTGRKILIRLQTADNEIFLRVPEGVAQESDVIGAGSSS